MENKVFCILVILKTFSKEKLDYDINERLIIFIPKRKMVGLGRLNGVVLPN